jgi:hypothetical protein
LADGGVVKWRPEARGKVKEPNRVRPKKLPSHITLTASVMLVLSLLVGGCGVGQGGASGQDEQSTQKPVVGEYVGTVSDKDAFVALVSEKPKEGEEKREVRAYLCDGQKINEWFVGQARTNKLKLSSEGGARLDARLTDAAATGTITLPNGNGKALSFEAPPATGVEGFYVVSVPSEEGQLSSTSTRGAQIQGSRSGAQVGATITPPEEGGRKPVDFNVSVPSIEEGDNRWILLAEGGKLGIKGAKKGAQAGFIDESVAL